MKKGFTLAEVLITMSIIAVVAMMTIPSLIKNYRYKAYASTLKQVVSQLEDAVKSSMADEHATSFTQSTAGVANNCTAGAETGPCYIFNKYLKTTFNCSSSSDKRCASENGYKSINGDDAKNIWNGDCRRLSNGATLCMVHNDTETNFAIDVNGPGQPNIIGIDLFTGIISDNGAVIDRSQVSSDCGVQISHSDDVDDYSAGCLHKVIENSWTIKDN